MGKKTPAEITRRKALAKHLDCKPSEIDVSRYDETTFEVGSAEYLVLTDDEADAKCRDAILDSVWAFRAEFLVSHFPDGLSVDDINRLRGDRCEDVNGAFLALIADKDHFVSDAISTDFYGRGHFLAGYDFEEHDVDGFYIYRVN